MDDRAVNQDPAVPGKFPVLDWPSPQRLQAANRLRAKAVSDMIVALGKWAIAFFANNPISRPPQDTANSHMSQVAAKR